MTGPWSRPDRAAAPPTQRAGVLDGPGAALDRLAALAARLIGCGRGEVSLLDDATAAGGAVHASAAVGRRVASADALCRVTAKSREPLVVTDARSDPRVAELGPVVSGEVGSYLGVPLVDAGGYTVGVLCVFDALAREWSENDVAVVSELAASVFGELELAALSAEYEADRARWEVAVDAGRIASFDWDVVTGRLWADERMVALFGFAPGSFDNSTAAIRARLHPDDVPRVTESVLDAIAACSEFEAEFRVVRPEDTCWVQARGRTLCGEDGTAVRLVGAAYDTTEVREGESRVARVLESMSAGFLAIDHEWRITYVNAEAERVLGVARADLLGRVTWKVFPAAIGSDFEQSYRRAVATGQPVSFDAYYPEPLHAWFEVRAWPGPDGLSVYFLDITARRVAEQSARQDAERLRLLAETSSALAGTLDADEAMDLLAGVVVPALADWCVVTLVEEERLRDVGIAHRDPRRKADVRAYADVQVRRMSQAAPIWRVLETGQPYAAPRIRPEALEAIFPDPQSRELLTRLDPTSGTAVPLAVRGRTLGVIGLWNTGTRPAHTAAEIDSAMEIGRRAALALDNAQLYARQSRMAESLQRSLLTEPVQPERLRIAVRYRPAAETAQIGGDWYDAFTASDGATCLVIGDVAGHDREAAAAMGQARNLLRGIAYTVADPPAAVLSALDRAMRDLAVGVLATGVFAKVEEIPSGEQAGSSGIRWSNAGHPPPLLIPADGPAYLLRTDADLLLGLDAGTPRADHAHPLPAGSTLLLYTDGLVERRGATIDDGLDWLVEAAGRLGSLDLDELCDALLALVDGYAEDDVALLVVRAHAGPASGPA